MRRVILLAGLVLALGALLPGSARPAAGGSDLPIKASFSRQSRLNLQTGAVNDASLFFARVTGEPTAKLPRPRRRK